MTRRVPTSCTLSLDLLLTVGAISIETTSCLKRPPAATPMAVLFTGGDSFSLFTSPPGVGLFLSPDSGKEIGALVGASADVGGGR